MPAPPIRYVRTPDGFDIAYWMLGRGPVLLHTPNVQLGHVRSEWSIEGMRSWYEDLSRSFTLVRYDHRGAGLSTRDGATQSIDALVTDIESVADEVASERLILLGWITGGLPAIAFAARRPERVSHLALWNSFASDASHRAPRMKALFGMAAGDWELFSESICHAALGWRDADAARQWAAVVRDGTTQAQFLAFLQTRRNWNVTGDLSRIRAPTLVMHDPVNALVDENRSRELARSIPGAVHAVTHSERGNPGPECLEALLTLVGARSSAAPTSDGLTRREREVLGLVVEGATNAEIAERLFISINTVTRHLTHIYSKTGTKRRADAVRYALSRGLNSY
jgi:DNA-binding CsgD family transcriptional regulator/pimeloyl-ACP methyl ester carboxylesterase